MPLADTWGAFAARPPEHRIGTRALEISISLYLLFTALTQWPFASYLWGWGGIARGQIRSQLGVLGGPVLWVFQQPLGAQAVLGLQILAAMMLLAGRWTLIAKLFAMFGFAAINARNPYLPDGGANILELTFYYLLFLSASAQGGSLRAWLHNLAVWVIRGQVIVVYLTAGISKLAGADWQGGTAMYVISRVEWFSLPLLADLFRFPLVTFTATYLTVAYQILFPLALFAARVRLGFIFFGIGLHLGIAVVMGLVAFSTIMIGLELFLINDREYAAIRQWIQVRWQRLNRRGRAARSEPPDPALPDPVLSAALPAPESLPEHWSSRSLPPAP